MRERVPRERYVRRWRQHRPKRASQARGKQRGMRVSPGAMPVARFWALIETTLASGRTEIADGDDLHADQQARIAALRATLEPLPPEELIAFRRTYDCMIAWAFHWDLWAAAYIIQGGCSDDGFDYFRDWLISRGRKVYEAAIDDPESLAGIAIADTCDFEAFRYIVGDVYEAKTGDDIYDAIMDDEVPAQQPSVGEPFDASDLETRFPKLARWINGQS